MSAKYSSSNSKQAEDIQISNVERHNRNDQNRRCNRNQYDGDSSSDCFDSKTRTRRKNRANKRKQQIDRNLMSSDSDIDTAIEYGYMADFDDPINSSIDYIDAYKCAGTNSSTERAFGRSTPFNQTQNHTFGYIKNSDVLQECCEKEPEIDTKMIDDLSKTLDEPQHELCQIVLFIQDLSYEHDPEYHRVNQAVRSFIEKRKWNIGEGISHFRRVRKSILDRCSYGFLIISKDKKRFLAVRNSHGQRCRGAPKGHQMMKVSGQWEKPFETAFREINEEIMYYNEETQQWSTLDEHHLEEYITYLECTLNAMESEYRRIGLFVVRLQKDLEFSHRDRKEIDKVQWFKFEDRIDPKEFYTLYPFIEFMRNHPELLYC